MERKRILEKQSITEEIKLLKKYIETDQATIDRLYKQTNCTDYTSAQIEKLTTKNEERTTTLAKLEQKYTDIEQGLCDDEINAEYKKTASEIKAKAVETKRKKIVENEEQRVLEEKSKEYYDTGRSYDRKQKYEQKDMDRSYNYFVNVCNSVPEYMSKKLKNMPNNKGYIWRGVHCYGERPAELNQPICMFENKKGILLTHEWTPTDYNVWQKEETSPNRKLVHTEKRKSKNNGYSLFDFVKKNDVAVVETVPEEVQVKEESVNQRSNNEQGYRHNRNNQGNNQGNQEHRQYRSNRNNTSEQRQGDSQSVKRDYQQNRYNGNGQTGSQTNNQINNQEQRPNRYNGNKQGGSNGNSHTNNHTNSQPNNQEHRPNRNNNNGQGRPHTNNNINSQNTNQSGNQEHRPNRNNNSGQGRPHTNNQNNNQNNNHTNNKDQTNRNNGGNKQGYKDNRRRGNNQDNNQDNNQGRVNEN